MSENTREILMPKFYDADIKIKEGSKTFQAKQADIVFDRFYNAFGQNTSNLFISTRCKDKNGKWHTSMGIINISEDQDPITSILIDGENDAPIKLSINDSFDFDQKTPLILHFPPPIMEEKITIDRRVQQHLLGDLIRTINEDETMCEQHIILCMRVRDKNGKWYITAGGRLLDGLDNAKIILYGCGPETNMELFVSRKLSPDDAALLKNLNDSEHALHQKNEGGEVAEQINDNGIGGLLMFGGAVIGGLISAMTKDNKIRVKEENVVDSENMMEEAKFILNDN